MEKVGRVLQETKSLIRQATSSTNRDYGEDFKLVTALESQNSTLLPPFNAALNATRLCWAGLTFTWMISFSTLIYSFVRFSGRIPPSVFYISFNDTYKASLVTQLVPLCFNIIVTICTETTGFIHSASLRWALYHENRLEFNSNLRLFRSATNSKPNSWYVNLIWGIALTVSYCAASQLLLNNPNYGSDQIDQGDNAWAGITILIVNEVAMCGLGCSLFIQAAFGTWCMLPSKSARILSWDPSPLNTALALRHNEYNVYTPEKVPQQPARRQPAAYTVHKTVRIILIYLCVLVPLVFGAATGLWFQSIAVNEARNHDPRPDMSFTNEQPNTSFVEIDQYNKRNWKGWPVVFLAIVSCFQVFITMAFHATEQLVNMSRDERQWRKAAGHGAPTGPGPIYEAFTSWQTVFLLGFKPVGHWLFGLSIQISSNRMLAFHPLPFFCLGLASAILAVFGFVLALYKPRGPQPTTWGNLHRLNQLIDDWGLGGSGRLFWGDKGQVRRGYRQAGTTGSFAKVSKIQFGVLYYGM